MDREDVPPPDAKPPGAEPGTRAAPAGRSPLRPAPAAGDDLAPRPGAPVEALRELALALRRSVETVHGVAAAQVDIARAIERQDRGELVLQSTQALNDSFRNLGNIQRELLARLQDGREGGRGGGTRLVPLLLLGLLVVFLGGVYVVLDVLEGVRQGRPEAARLAAEASERSRAAYREGKEDAEEAARRGLEDLRLRLAQVEAGERAARERLEAEGASREDLERTVRALEGERDDLASRIRAAEAQAVARLAVEEELRSQEARWAAAEPRLARLEADLSAEKAENARLRQKLAAYGLGLADPTPTGPAPAAASDAGGSAPPAPPGAALPAARPAPAERVDRDPRLVEKVRSRLNEMLDASARGRDERWQITNLGGVTPDRLDGVVALRYDGRSGRVLEQVLAEEARLVVDRSTRRVEMDFRRGRTVRAGSAAPLPDGGLTQVVAEGEMTRLFSQSGLLFVKFR
jgi:hypothetical protein